MNLLLVLLIYVGSVYGCIKFIISRFKKTITLMSSGSNQMIGDGSINNITKEKVKFFDKQPMNNPEVQQVPVMNLNTNTNTNTNNVPAVPNYQMDSQPRMQVPNVSGGGGVSAVAVVGLVNGIGGFIQSGNIANKFRANRQITGPIYQGGSMIYNSKFKGVRGIDQGSSNIINTINRGKLSMQQKGNMITGITKGKVNISSTGQSLNNVYGNVRRITMPQGYIKAQGTQIMKKIEMPRGAIKAKGLEIKGVSKAQQLFVKNFVAPKGTKVKIQQLQNQNQERLAENPSITQNTGIVLNDINLQKASQYHVNSQHYKVDTNQQLTTIGLSKVFMDPKNQRLTRQQKVKLYTLNRIQEHDTVIASGNSSNYLEDRSRNDKEDMYRQIVQMVPELTTEQMRNVANRASEMREKRRRDRQMIAAQKTEQRFNASVENRRSLDDLLRDTSNVSAHFNAFIEDNFKDDIHSFSEAEIKEIEQKARENVNAREGMSLEEKEREFLNEKAKLQKDKEEDNLKGVEEFVKEQILKDPNLAKEILGKDEVELLKAEFNNNDQKKEKMYQQELRRQDSIANQSFRKKHPEYKSSNYYEVYKARMEEETVQDIQVAARELYSNSGKLVSNDRLNQVRESMYPSQEKQQDNPSNIFIPRKVQEAEGRRTVNM